ncbi:hypothetical protein D3C86_1957180 [compost metagenome]
MIKVYWIKNPAADEVPAIFWSRLISGIPNLFFAAAGCFEGFFQVLRKLGYVRK